MYGAKRSHIGSLRGVPKPIADYIRRYGLPHPEDDDMSFVPIRNLPYPYDLDAIYKAQEQRVTDLVSCPVTTQVGS